MKIIRFVLIGVGVLLGLTLVAAAGTVWWVQSRDMRGTAEWAARKQGFDVAFDGPVRVKLWPQGEVSVGAMALTGADGKPLVRLDEAHVQWRWGGGLLPWKGLQLAEFSAKNPTVVLTRGKDGVGNWEGLAGREAAAKGEAPVAASKPSTELPLGMLASAKLDVTNLNLTYTDAMTGRKVEARKVNLAASNNGTVAATKLSGSVNGQAIDGNIQADLADMDNVPVTGRLNAAGLGVAVDGRVMKQNAFAGQVNAQTANLKQTLGALLGQAPAQAPAAEFHLVGDMEYGAEQVSLRNFSTRLGELLQASGDATVKMGGTPSASGKVRVQGNNLRQLAELATGAAQPRLPAAGFTASTNLSGQDAIVLKDLRVALANLLTASGEVTLVPVTGKTPDVDANLSVAVPSVQALAKSFGQAGSFPAQPVNVQFYVKARGNTFDVRDVVAQLADVAALRAKMSVVMGDKPKVDGDFKLDGANLKTAAAAFGVAASALPASPFKASASVSGQGTVDVKDLVVDLPQLVEATGDLSVTLGTPLNVNGSVNVARLNATALGYCAVEGTPAAPGAAGAATTARAAAAPWTDTPLDLGALRSVAVDLKVKVDGLDCARFPAKSLSARVQNTPSQLDVSDLNVALSNGGSVASTLRLEHAGTPALVLRLTTSKLPVEELVPVLKAKNVVLPLNVVAQLDSRGASTRALAQNLGGTLTMDATEGRLPYTNMLGSISGIVGALQGVTSTTPASNGSGDVDRLTARYTIRQGVASTDELTVATGNGAMTLVGTGTIDIAGWALNYMLTPTLHSGTQGLAIPVAITGPLTAPKIGPDPNYVSRVTGRLAGEALKGVLGKENAKGLGGVIGGVLGGQGVSKTGLGNLLQGVLQPKQAAEAPSGTTDGGAAPAGQPANPVENLLRGVLSR